MNLSTQSNKFGDGLVLDGKIIRVTQNANSRSEVTVLFDHEVVNLPVGQKLYIEFHPLCTCSDEVLVSCSQCAFTK